MKRYANKIWRNLNREQPEFNNLKDKEEDL